MQIHQIQYNNPSFGYNVELNKKLIDGLGNAKRNKVFYNYVKDYGNLINNLEQSLRCAEKKQMPELTDRLASLFIPMKLLFTALIEYLQPNYDYKNKEMESYESEIKERNIDSEEKHWLKSVVEGMHDEDYNDTQPQTMMLVENQAFQGMLPILYGATVVSSSEGVYEQDIDNAEYTANGKNKKSALENSIELGKEKVIEYIPSGNALQGFASLGGMKELKATLEDKVIDYLKDPEQAKQDAIDYGTKLPKALLFYGPPGCGKTTVIKHMAVEAGVPLLMLETGKLKSAYIHETSTNIDAAFDYAESIATPDKPVIMMLDDAESSFLARNGNTTTHEGEELSTFLHRINDAPGKNVLVALTTNKYDIMDSAIKSRFDTSIYVGLPDKEARVSILKLLLSRNSKSTSLANNDNALNKLAQKLEGYSIRTMEDMTVEACNIARKEAKNAKLQDGKIVRRDVTLEDFEKVIAKPEYKNLKLKNSDYVSKDNKPSIGF